MSVRLLLLLPVLIFVLVCWGAMVDKRAAADEHGVELAASNLDAPPGTAARKPSTATATERVREGTRLVDRLGRFQFAGEGDRIAFFPNDSKDSYRVLENLALERVSEKLVESRGKPEWVVSGTITEFRGSNYLLMTRVVIRAASDRPLSP